MSDAADDACAGMGATAGPRGCLKAAWLRRDKDGSDAPTRRARLLRGHVLCGDSGPGRAGRSSPMARSSGSPRTTTRTGSWARAPLRITSCALHQQVRGPQGRGQPHRLPRVPEGRRDDLRRHRRRRPTASPAARRCGSPAAPTRQPAPAGSRSTTATFEDTAHLKAYAGRRHRGPQRRPTVGSTASRAARRCWCAATSGAGCTAPTLIDGRRSRSWARRRRRRRTCASSRRRARRGQHRRQPALPHRGRLAAADRPVTTAKVVIDSRTLVQNGTGTTALPHLRPAPSEGTFLNAGGTMYRVAGQAPVQLSNCAVLSNCPGAVAVDASTDRFARRRAPARRAPRTAPSCAASRRRRLWEIVGGMRRQTFVNVAGRRHRRHRDRLVPAPGEPDRARAGARRAVRAGHHQLLHRQPQGHEVHGAERPRRVPAGSKVTITCSRRLARVPVHVQEATARRSRAGARALSTASRTAAIRGGVTLTVKITSPTGARKYGYFKLPAR